MAMSVQDALARLVGLFGPQATWDPTKLYGNLMVSPSGNILVGTTVDDGLHKLQINGTTLLGGSGLVFPDSSLQYSASPKRNRIINGMGRVAQRGTSVTAGTVNTYGGPDRFICFNTVPQGAFTQSQGSMTVSGLAMPCVTQTVTTAVSSFSAASKWSGIFQLIEGYNAWDLVGQPISSSFLFYTNVTGTYGVALVDNGSTHSCVQTFQATAGVVTLVQLTFPASSSLVIPNSNAQGLYVFIGALTGSTNAASTYGSWLTGTYQSAASATNWAATVGNFIAATKIKIEEGPVCSPYDEKGWGDLLIDCQRYYEITENLSEYGLADAGNVFGFSYPYRVLKRISPSMAVGSLSTSNCTVVLASTNIDNFQINPTITATGPFGYSASVSLGWHADF